MSHPLRLAFVCTGNICRSPLAEVVMRNLIESNPLLAGALVVESGATHGWHVGDYMDPRAKQALLRAGIDDGGTPAALADKEFVSRQDLIFVMTTEHRETILSRRRNEDTTVLLLRDITEPGKNKEVADPYYGTDDDFDFCLEQITQNLSQWTLEFLQTRGE